MPSAQHVVARVVPYVLSFCDVLSLAKLLCKSECLLVIVEQELKT